MEACLRTRRSPGARRSWIIACVTSLLALLPARAVLAQRVIAWGYNDYGQCNVPSPNTAFVAVAAGYGHSLGLKSDGSIVAWGGNYFGQCDVPSPNTGFVAVAAGDRHSLGLKSDGTIVAWGWNYFGQCNVPAPNADFISIAAGGINSLGLKSDGSIIAWGNNSCGQLNVPSPNAGFVAVAAGWSHSLGLKSDGPVVREAKVVEDGKFACIYGAIISAAWPDVFYIEADNRSAGMRVVKSSHGLTEGERANVAGTVSTNPDGERYINASFVVKAGSGNVKPLGMPNRSLGGGDWQYDGGTGKGQKGVKDGSGLNNIGLLVTTWGDVVEIEEVTPPALPTWFRIDDGSGVTVKYVVPSDVTIEDDWEYVVVTGVSSCEKVGDDLQRVLRVRDESDIVAY